MPRKPSALERRGVILSEQKASIENLEVLSVSQELLSLAFHEAKFMFRAKTLTDN